MSLPYIPQRCQVCLQHVVSEGHVKIQHHNGNYDLYLYLCKTCLERAVKLLEEL